jgi:hypothetical protein
MNPMDEPEIRINRVKLAFAIAVIADLCEFPVTWFEHFGWEWVQLMGRAAGLVLDCCVMWVLTKVLGFNWVFVPSFLIECIPTLDLFPSWVGAVAYVVWQRKKSQQMPQGQSPALRPLIDVQEVKAIGASLVSRLTLPAAPTLPAQSATPEETHTSAEAAAEQRLQRLAELRDKNLISQTEYEAKRQQILADL